MCPSLCPAIISNEEKQGGEVRRCAAPLKASWHQTPPPPVEYSGKGGSKTVKTMAVLVPKDPSHHSSGQGPEKLLGKTAVKIFVVHNTS